MEKTTKPFVSPQIQISGLLNVLGVLGGVVSLLGFLGRFHWALDLFSHFRVQYIVCLTLLGVAMLVARIWRSAAMVIGLVVINLCVVLPYCIWTQSNGSKQIDSPVVRALLINVNTRQGNPARVQRLVLEMQPDLVVLEEISEEWMAALPQLVATYPHSVVEPREDNFGIGLFSKVPLVDTQVAYVGSEVPTIIATAEFQHTRIRVVATHPLPPIGGEYSESRNRQLASLPVHLKSDLPVILLGDLNTTPWNFHFQKLLRESGLRDSSVGRGLQPTWPSNALVFRIPLDHFLYSAQLQVLSRSVGPDVGSDHFPLLVEFITTQPVQSEG
ncbi:MAG: endonuclease/exonuclease/phosphatase family protein [Pirellula sp.]